jgi:hypothetical protein
MGWDRIGISTYFEGPEGNHFACVCVSLSTSDEKGG